MKHILLIITLMFTLQSWTNAEDIKEFEIEGVTIGDSLLKYADQKEIKNNSSFLQFKKIWFIII